MKWSKRRLERRQRELRGPDTKSYYDKNKQEYVICLDDARFFNHSTSPNLDERHPTKTIARHDILPGEELTVNYFEYDSDAKRKLTHSI